MIFNNSLNFINNSYIFSKKKIRSLYLNSNIYDRKITPSIVSSLDYYPSPNLLDSFIKFDKKKINIKNYSLNKVWDNKNLREKDYKNLNSFFWLFSLDLKSSKVRIRLNSSVVKVEHTPNQESVNVTYIHNGESFRIKGKHVIMACYNNMLPHLCPELPLAQKEALDYATKIPLVYISIAVRNWRAFSNLGFHSITIPQPKLMHSFGLDFPVSMGGYDFAQNPNQPTILHGTYVPTDPDKGLNSKQQAINGRRQLYEISFDQFERDIIEQMQGSLRVGVLMLREISQA